MPCEAAAAATVAVRVRLPDTFTQVRGATNWRGRTRQTLRLHFVATPRSGGDFRLPVTQTYSNGEIVHWAGPPTGNTPAPVVHIGVPENANRDRLIILVIAGAVGVAAFALRRLR